MWLTLLYWWTNLNEIACLKDTCIYESITLTWIKETGWEGWTELICLRTETQAGVKKIVLNSFTWTVFLFFFFCHSVTISDHMIIPFTVTVRGKVCSGFIAFHSKVHYSFIFLYRISHIMSVGPILCCRKLSACWSTISHLSLSIFYQQYLFIHLFTIHRSSIQS
jgi:hypothetical protein